jgi:hypothetical protein
LFDDDTIVSEPDRPVRSSGVVLLCRERQKKSRETSSTPRPAAKLPHGHRDSDMIDDDFIVTEPDRPVRVSGVVPLCTERRNKSREPSSTSRLAENVVDLESQDHVDADFTQALSCISDDSARPCSKAKRRKDRRKPLDEALETPGTEFDTLAREGRLDAFLRDKERNLLLETSNVNSSRKGREEQNFRALTSGVAGGLPRVIHGGLACLPPKGCRKRMKTRTEMGTLHLAHVYVPAIVMAKSPLAAPFCSVSKKVPNTQVDAAEIDPVAPEVITDGNIRVSISKGGTSDAQSPCRSAPRRKSGRLSMRCDSRGGRLVVTGSVIDLTADDDPRLSSMNSSKNNNNAQGTSRMKAAMSPSVLTNSGTNQSSMHACGPVTLVLLDHPGLKPLSVEEEELVDVLTKGKCAREPLATIPLARITLCRDDFKRLRGVRWLNDELINAYMALINQRNEFHMQMAHSTSGAKNRPRTYVFNTYFYTRLVASGYDFPGVARWTRRAGVDVAEKDLILVPVNLGNNHWVLAGIDVLRQMFLYLDSMHGHDMVGVVASLKRWFYDEVHEKHGVAAANALGVDAWTVLCNQYVPYRFTKCNAVVESGSPRRSPMAPLRIPVQRDSGSCGVFTAMIADCLEMGVKVFFKHHNIKLVRSRMALDLYRRMLPG